MAKLYFRYGAMGSSKTANAIMVRHNYEERGQKALMLVAVAAASALGHTISAFEIMPFLTYPLLLLISSLIYIFVIPEKKSK